MNRDHEERKASEVERRKSIGAVIKALREARGMTRAELSTATASIDTPGVGLDMLAKIEQGVKAPSVPTLRKLANALNVTAEDVFERSNAWQYGRAQGTSPALLRSIAMGMTMSAAVLNPIRIVPAAIAGASVGGAVDRKRLEKALRDRLLADFLETASDEAVAELAARMGADDLLRPANTLDDQDDPDKGRQ